MAAEGVDEACGDGDWCSRGLEVPGAGGGGVVTRAISSSRRCGGLTVRLVASLAGMGIRRRSGC